MGGRGDGPELADGPRFRRFCGGGSHAGVLRCLALRGSQTRPVEAILEICAMAQSSSHMSFACLQMPDELSALIQGIVRERVHRNWPLVLAFEIRAGRRELRQREFVAVMPCALTNAQYDREQLWLGKGAGFLGSGGRDAQSIQWLQHNTFRGASCWVETCSASPLRTSAIVAAGFDLNPIHLPTLASRLALVISLQQPIRNRAPPTFSMPPSVLHMLASACESARCGYGAHVRCWILTGVSARQRTAAALNRRLGLESDLLAESSIFVAESDGCPSQFAFHSQP